MKRVLLIVMFLMTLHTAVFGQHGTAPKGYYPAGYAGDTWTGEVVSGNDKTREITLVYKNEEKSETFTGILMSNVLVKMGDGSIKEWKPSGYRKGERITVFYQTKTRKVDGNKVRYYEIFRITKAN